MKITKRPQGIIFDLDGTLADTLPQLALAARQACMEVGLRAPDTEQAKSYVGNGVTLLLSRAACGGKRVREHDAPFDLEHLTQGAALPADGEQSHEVTPEDIDPSLLKKLRIEFNRFYSAGLHENFKLYPGVKEGLSFFKQQGIKLAVCTNKPQMFAVPLLRFMGIYDCFDFILGGEVLAQRKPDPAPVLYVCGRLGLYPQQCVMVGDSENDVFAGQRALMPSVFFTYGYFTGDPATISPDHEFDDFRDFKNLISDLRN